MLSTGVFACLQEYATQMKNSNTNIGRGLLYIATLTILLFSAFPATASSLEDGEAAFRAKDYERAMKLLKPSAARGVPKAQVLIARMYAFGLGIAKDVDLAFSLAKKAAARGSPEGQTVLGAFYLNGIGTPADTAEGLKFYTLAAAQGHAPAQLALGYQYSSGRQVTQDYIESNKWYRMAADQGEAGGQNGLGNAYQSGRGVVKDLDEALKWYRLAAAQGSIGGQMNLANMYELGQGVAKNYEEAARWYLLAAAQGFAPAKKKLEVEPLKSAVAKIDPATASSNAGASKPTAKSNSAVGTTRSASSKILSEVEYKTTKGCKAVFHMDVSEPANKKTNRLDWSGRCVGGYVDGDGTMKALWTDGEIRTIVATFVKGREEGYGTEVRSNGAGRVTYKGNYVRGMPQGRGEKTWDSEKGVTKKYVGEFVDAVPEGKGRYETENFEYEGEFRSMQFHGKGTLRYSNGVTISGYFINGNTPTSGHIENSNGVVYDGQLSNGRPEGQGRMIYTNLTIYAGEFSDGQPNGEGTHTANGKTTNVTADKGKLTRRYDAAEIAETARIEEQGRANAQEAQEQFELRAQWEREQIERQQADAQRRVALCMSAMFGRSTKTGGFGESSSNANKCNSDSNAHLIALPPSYVCRRDFRGAVQCDPQ